MSESKYKKMEKENKKRNDERINLSDIEKTFQYKNFQGKNC